jgi:hypothetical protein
MGHGPGSARSVETPLLVLKALDLARASASRVTLPVHQAVCDENFP